MAKLFEFQAESMPSWWDGNYQSQAVRDVLTEIQKDGSSQVVIVPTVYMDGLSSTTVFATTAISVGTTSMAARGQRATTPSERPFRRPRPVAWK
jgi:protoheme ferro-lyase